MSTAHTLDNLATAVALEAFFSASMLSFLDKDPSAALRYDVNGRDARDGFLRAHNEGWEQIRSALVAGRRGGVPAPKGVPTSYVDFTCELARLTAVHLVDGGHLNNRNGDTT